MDWLIKAREPQKIETPKESKIASWHQYNRWRVPNLIFCTIFFIIGCIGLSVPLTSCESRGPKSVSTLDPVRFDPAIKSVDEGAKTSGTVAEKVGESAKKIDEHTGNIESKTSTNEVFPAIQPELQGIKQETGNLRQDQADLLVLQKQLEATKADLMDQKTRYDAVIKNGNELRGKIAQQEKEIAHLKEENGKLFKKLVAWLGVICIGGIGLSAVLGFFTRSPAAIFLGLGFLVTLGVSIVVSLYMTWIAYITIGAAVLIGGIAIVYVMRHQYAERKALVETVHTNEVSKQYLDPKARLHIFGNGPEGGVADNIQSSSTKKIVAQIRKSAEKSSTKKFALAAPLPTPIPLASMSRTQPKTSTASAVFG